MLYCIVWYVGLNAIPPHPLKEHLGCPLFRHRPGVGGEGGGETD